MTMTITTKAGIQGNVSVMGENYVFDGSELIATQNFEQIQSAIVQGYRNAMAGSSTGSAKADLKLKVSLNIVGEGDQTGRTITKGEDFIEWAIANQHLSIACDAVHRLRSYSDSPDALYDAVARLSKIKGTYAGVDIVLDDDYLYLGEGDGESNAVAIDGALSFLIQIGELSSDLEIKNIVVDVTHNDETWSVRATSLKGLITALHLNTTAEKESIEDLLNNARVGLVKMIESVGGLRMVDGLVKIFDPGTHNSTVFTAHNNLVYRREVNLKGRQKAPTQVTLINMIEEVRELVAHEGQIVMLEHTPLTLSDADAKGPYLTVVDVGGNVHHLDQVQKLSKLVRQSYKTLYQNEFESYVERLANINHTIVEDLDGALNNLQPWLNAKIDLELVELETLAPTHPEDADSDEENQVDDHEIHDMIPEDQEPSKEGDGNNAWLKAVPKKD